MNRAKKLSKYFIYPSLVFLLLTLISCTITFGEDFDNTPEGNYDFFFYELSQSYAYKDYTFENGLSLDQIQAAEKEGLDDSWESLRNALDRVINVHLQDPHIYSKYSPIPAYDIADNTLFQNTRGTNFDSYLPDESILISWIDTSSIFIRYGVVAANPNIGYIYIKDLVDEVGGSDRLTSSSVFGSLTDTIVSDFSSRSVDRIIFDIRSSAGGAVYRGKEIASRFVSSERTFMISEYLTGPNSFDTVNEKISPKGKPSLRGMPLVVLVNSNTCSGGEMLVLMLQQTDGYKATMGTPTYGCTGTIGDKELLNGWIIRITTSRTFTPDRTDYFKVGLQPNIVVRQTGSTDNVLENAIVRILNY